MASIFNKPMSKMSNVIVKANGKRIRSWFGIRWFVKDNIIVCRFVPKGDITITYYKA